MNRDLYICQGMYKNRVDSDRIFFFFGSLAENVMERFKNIN